MIGSVRRNHPSLCLLVLTQTPTSPASDSALAGSGGRGGWACSSPGSPGWADLSRHSLDVLPAPPARNMAYTICCPTRPLFSRHLPSPAGSFWMGNSVEQRASLLRAVAVSSYCRRPTKGWFVSLPKLQDYPLPLHPTPWGNSARSPAVGNPLVAQPTASCCLRWKIRRQNLMGIMTVEVAAAEVINRLTIRTFTSVVVVRQWAAGNTF